MRVAVQSVVSERTFGVIVSARVVDAAHALHDRLLRVKAGNAAMLGRPVPGEVWDVEGEVKETRYGQQVEAARMTRALPTGRLIRDYLAAHAPGVGPERADALWARFGLDLPTVLSSSGNLTMIAEAIAPDRPNLAVKLAAACQRAWAQAQAETRTVAWLTERGFDDVRTAMRVVKILGERAVERLEANPYALTTLLPWPDVDALGLKLLTEAGVPVPRGDRRRLVGAVDSAVKAAIAEGDTAIAPDRLNDLVARALRVGPTSPLIADAVRVGAANGAVLESPVGWRAPGCASMEEGVASRLHRMLRADYPNPVVLPDAGVLGTLLDDLLLGGRPLHPEQREAVLRTLQRPLACLQGGAGTGKTTTTKAICDVWERHGGRLLLCALAGKAALRLSRSTGRLAMTLSRLLGQIDQRERLSLELADGGLTDGRWRVLEARLAQLAELTPTTLVVVDEASMVDLATMHALLRRLPEGARLLLVGDEAQLPPVGFGLVYHRLVTDGALTARLTAVHRQSAATGIPAVSAAIRDGRLPVLGQWAGKGDGVSLLDCPADEVPGAVEAVWDALGGLDGETLIVTPTNDGDAGIVGLNKRLHARRVAHAGCQEVKGYLGQWFSPGEPVVWLRNDYERGLFNGLLGRVVAVDAEDRACTVIFDGYDEPHVIAGDALLDLALAYAITCHRAQGSQAPAVVVPLTRSRLLDLSWLYTAVTRSERQVVLVGPQDALTEALARPSTANRRHVGFAWKSRV